MPNTPANQLFSTGTLGMPTQDGHVFSVYSVPVNPDQYAQYRDQDLFAGVLVKRDATKGLILATESGGDGEGVNGPSSPTFTLGALSICVQADQICLKVNEVETFVGGEALYFDGATGMFTKIAPAVNPIKFAEALSTHFQAINPEKMIVANASPNSGQYGNAVIARLLIPIQ